MSLVKLVFFQALWLCYAGEAQEAWQSRLPSVPEVVRDSHRKAEERGIPNGLHGSFQGDTKSRSAFAPPGRPPGARLNGMRAPGASPPRDLIQIPPRSHVDSLHDMCLKANCMPSNARKQTGSCL